MKSGLMDSTRRAAEGRGEFPGMVDLNTLPLPELFRALVDEDALARLVELARAEDVGEQGDITSDSIIPRTTRGRAALMARSAGVVCAQFVGDAVVREFSANVDCAWKIYDGAQCAAGAVIAEFRGNLRDLFRIERMLLNFVGRLSGIATLARQFVERVRGTHAVICDTRKTTPGMRGLEKYAARCGGVTLHRVGLYDAVLYKDNHLAAIEPGDLKGALETAARRVRSDHPVRFVEVEVDSLERLEEVLSIKCGLIDIILLDNMPPEMLQQAVEMRNRTNGAVQLEASGGVTLDTVRAIAETGVERISVGAITHSAPALNVALDFVGNER